MVSTRKKIYLRMQSEGIKGSNTAAASPLLSRTASSLKRQRDVILNDHQCYNPRDSSLSKKGKHVDARRSHQPVLFLPTHLTILRALHADDDMMSAPMADSCPRPSWVEVNRFVQLQASVKHGAIQNRRIARLLRALGGGDGGRETSPPSSMRAESLNVMGRGERGILKQKQQMGRIAQPIRADQAGGVEVCSSTVATTEAPSQANRAEHAAVSLGAGLKNFTLADPRYVVCAVLRRAVINRSDECNSTVPKKLQRGVDDVVENLASSLKRLVRDRGDRETPWRLLGKADGLHVEDVIERHANKLVLWRRLQAALSTFCAFTEAGDG